MSARGKKQNETIEEEDADKIKMVFDSSDVCNQVQHSFHYYKYRSNGLIYQKTSKNKSSDLIHSIYADKKELEKNQSRPVKKVFINIDREVAGKMFGYRVKFERENMRTYVGEGIPAVRANQSHKPIHALTQ